LCIVRANDAAGLLPAAAAAAAGVDVSPVSAATLSSRPVSATLPPSDHRRSSRFPVQRVQISGGRTPRRACNTNNGFQSITRSRRALSSETDAIASG